MATPNIDHDQAYRKVLRDLKLSTKATEQKENELLNTARSLKDALKGVPGDVPGRTQTEAALDETYNKVTKLQESRSGAFQRMLTQAENAYHQLLEAKAQTKITEQDSVAALAQAHGSYTKVMRTIQRSFDKQIAESARLYAESAKAIADLKASVLEGVVKAVNDAISANRVPTGNAADAALSKLGAPPSKEEKEQATTNRMQTPDSVLPPSAKTLTPNLGKSVVGESFGEGSEDNSYEEIKDRGFVRRAVDALEKISKAKSNAVAATESFFNNWLTKAKMLGAAALLAATYWDEIKDMAGQSWTSLKLLGNMSWEKMKATGAAAWDTIKVKGADYFESAKAKTLSWVDSLKSKGANWLEEIRGYSMKQWGQLVDRVEIWMKPLSAKIDEIKAAVSWFTEESKVGKALSSAGKAAAAATSKVTSMASGAGSAVMDAVDTASSAVTRAVSKGASMASDVGEMGGALLKRAGPLVDSARSTISSVAAPVVDKALSMGSSAAGAVGEKTMDALKWGGKWLNRAGNVGMAVSVGSGTWDEYNGERVNSLDWYDPLLDQMKTGRYVGNKINQGVEAASGGQSIGTLLHRFTEPEYQEKTFTKPVKISKPQEVKVVVKEQSAQARMPSTPYGGAVSVNESLTVSSIPTFAGNDTRAMAVNLYAFGGF